MKKMTTRLSIICVFMMLGMSAFAASPLTHTLQKGETLYSISKKYKVPYEALAAANGITDPTKLRTGSVLVIPSVHVVAKGETLYGISRQYGISINELLSANKLNPGYVLKIGDLLVIPASVAVQTPTTTSVSVQPPSPTSTTGGGSTTPSTDNGSGKPAPAGPGSTTSTNAAPAAPTTSNGSGKTTVTSVPMPDPVKTQDKTVDMKLDWPSPGKAMYLDGKLEGIMIRVKPGETAKAIAAGTVVSAGPSRGFNQVAFVQAKSGYVYVYGGNESLFVKTGDQVASGKEIGKIGIDAKDGSPIAYFFVFRNGQPIDPALAPRD